MAVYLAYTFHQLPSDILDPHNEMTDFEQFYFNIAGMELINEELADSKKGNKNVEKSDYMKKRIEELKNSSRGRR